MYDGNERLIKEIGFDGRKQHYKYDAAGHLIKHLDAGEVLTEFTRDALGQMRAKKSQFLGVKDDATAPQMAPQITRYNYDPKGRLLEAHNAEHYLGFTYNALGLRTHEQHCDLNAQQKRLPATQRDTQYSHVWPGILSGIQLPDGNQIHYGFDTYNQLTGVAYNGEIISQIERDAFGRETTRHQGALSTHTEYDPAGRLAKQTSTNQLNKTQGPIQREYGYNAFGNIEQLTEGTGDAQTHTRFVYDLINRLERVEGNHPETFDFDPASNLLSITNGKNSSASSKQNHAQADGNRLLMQGDKKFTYDKRGNLIGENRVKDGKLVMGFVYTDYHSYRGVDILYVPFSMPLLCADNLQGSGVMSSFTFLTMMFGFGLFISCLLTRH